MPGLIDPIQMYIVIRVGFMALPSGAERSGVGPLRTFLLR